MYIIFNLSHSPIRMYYFIYSHPVYIITLRLSFAYANNGKLILYVRSNKKKVKMTEEIIIKIICIASQRSDDDGGFVKRLRYSKCRQSHGD